MVVVVDTVSATPLRPRHPEKVNRPDALSPPKPDWIGARADHARLCRHPQYREGEWPGHGVRGGGLWRISASAGTDTPRFMIMGDTCTRACAFCERRDRHAGCASIQGRGYSPEATFKLGLAHNVITSSIADDLAGRGRQHFAQTIRAIRARCPATTIEILTPDFLRRREGALEVVVAAKPDVFNHNLETVPSRYLNVRPGARYFHSIRLLQRVKEIDPAIFTKSGIMVGLGEERHEVLQVMDDLRSADVDFLTIGRYLQPTRSTTCDALCAPDEFSGYEKVAYTKGFLMVSASP